PLRWAEIVCLDILWSEHCSYKSTRPLLGRLPTQAPQVILGPGEDAGVVTLGEHEGKRYAAVIGHESHNHPSQVVPYEGAATGVGGIVRDVACMGARVCGTLDGLRFGTGSKKGGARTREIVREVVAGIADYGNALGVPNLGGDVQFDEGFDANCLVNVVAVGVVEAERLVRSRVPSAEGDWAFVLAGKPTDASGFGGASFASTVLSDAESERRRAARRSVPPARAHGGQRGAARARAPGKLAHRLQGPGSGRHRLCHGRARGRGRRRRGSRAGSRAPRRRAAAAVGAFVLGDAG